MTAYYYQDLIFTLAGFFLVGLLAGHALYKKPSYLLIVLTTLFSLAGLTDVIFRYNTDPTTLMLADSTNVFCALFALTILLQFSMQYFCAERVRACARYQLLLYLPALLLTLAYAVTPFMVRGITAGAAGFRLTYNDGYWAVLVFGAICLALTAAISIYLAIERPEVRERERAAFLLFALGLFAYYYTVVLALPFLVRAPNFASPLPLTCATLVLVYACVKYEHFSDQPSAEPKPNAEVRTLEIKYVNKG
ncbi:MAG: hypothetical protein MUC35_07050 [Candidatus Margulisbacteria bacterium]|jgi:hypothetical protein|nr:hypothetical protein [Candidatus Margulisiibacteriota bacterium]